MKRYTKDPDSVLDYTIDWGTNWLADGETISSSSWTVQSGLTEDSDSNTTTTATVWLSGGTAGSVYTVTNQITTSAGRTAERTLLIKVEDR